MYFPLRTFEKSSLFYFIFFFTNICDWLGEIFTQHEGIQATHSDKSTAFLSGCWQEMPLLTSGDSAITEHRQKYVLFKLTFRVGGREVPLSHHNVHCVSSSEKDHLNPNRQVVSQRLRFCPPPHAPSPCPTDNSRQSTGLPGHAICSTWNKPRQLWWHSATWETAAGPYWKGRCVHIFPSAYLHLHILKKKGRDLLSWRRMFLCGYSSLVTAHDLWTSLTEVITRGTFFTAVRKTIYKNTNSALHCWAACNLNLDRWNCLVRIPSPNTNFPLCTNKSCIAGCLAVFPRPFLDIEQTLDITQTVNSRLTINSPILSAY